MLTITSSCFKQHIAWLAEQGYVGVTASEWSRSMRYGNPLPEKAVLITFDDGYADIANHAFPVLLRHGFKATVFIVTAQFGGTNTWDEKEGAATLRLLTHAQMKYWAGQGIEFGAHSRTHPELTKLSPTECEEEVAGSKRDLQELLGVAITSFAYPYGDQDESVRRIVRREYDLAFTIMEGLNYRDTDPYLLRRAYIDPNDSLSTFGINVSQGGLRKMRKLHTKFNEQSIESSRNGRC